MPDNEPVLSIDRFTGVSNTQRGTRLSKPPLDGTPVAMPLKSALNMDVDDSFSLETRQGYSLIPGMDNVTSAYATKDETRLYVVADGHLLSVSSLSPLVTDLLRSNLPEGEIFWCEAGNFVFYSGAAQGIIDGITHYEFGIPSAPAPYMQSIEGTLPPGLYQAACVFVDSHGREGGALPASQIELFETGGISMTIPEVDGLTTVIYVSSVNGDQLYRLDEAQGNTYNWFGNEPSTYSLDEAQKGAYPPPSNGSVITFRDSRLWVADYLQAHNTTYIFYSQPFWYHLFDLSQDYIAVPGKVLLMVQTPNGMVIGTDREIYAYSNEGGLLKLASYGVVSGHNFAMTEEETAVFWSQRGLCVGLPFKNLTDDKYSVPPGTRAGVSIIEQNGRKKAVVVTRSGGDSNNPY